MRSALRLVVVASLVVGSLGCAGSGSGSEDVVPGFYRGALNFNAHAGFPSGVAPTIAEITSNDDMTLQSLGGGLSADISVVSGNDTAVINGTAYTVEVDTNASPLDNTVGITVRQGTEVFANGVLTKSPLPSLGNQSLTPPQGEYAGEMLIVSEGKAVELGAAVGTVREGDNLVMAIEGGDEWFDGNDVVFVAKFQPNNVLTNATLLVNGGDYGQVDPRYSFDGQNLIVRFHGIPAKPSTIWLTLRMVPQG
jgi:hypothetical protein